MSTLSRSPVTAYFVSPYTARSLPALKFAALYFDHVVLPQSAILAALPEDTSAGPSQLALGPKAPMPMVDERFLDLVRPLRREGLLSVRSVEDARRDTQALSTARDAIRNLLSKRPDLIARESVTGRISDVGEVRPGLHVLGEYIPSSITVPHEVRAVIEKHFGTLAPGHAPPLDFMYAYYGALLGESLCLMAEGQFPITGSAVLDSCMQYVLLHDSVVSNWPRSAPAGSVTPRVAHELLSVSLPDVSMLSFEDMLEARDRLGSGLQRLRDAISRLSHSLTEAHDHTGLLVDLPSEVNAHVVPAVEELKATISASRDRVIADLAASLKDARNWVPFMTTLLSGLPVYIAVIASLAAAAVHPVAEYVGRQRELARNGLYGLIRLDRRLRKWTYE